MLSRALVAPRYACAALTVSAVTLALMSFLIPASAGAYATPGPAPVPGSPGLPDGRIYELVSPANKPGTEAAPERQGRAGEIWAAADGRGVGFGTTGAMGDAPAGREEWAVARRSGGAWKTYGAIPLPLGGVYRDILETETSGIGFSAAFTKSIFRSAAPYVVGEPEEEGELARVHPQSIPGYIYSLETNSTAWLGEPFLSTPALPFPGYASEEPTIIGASSDLSTAYFFEHGEYYEWHEGQVSPAGVLPDGSLDPNGAAPAGISFVVDRDGETEQTAEDANNEVSEDGRRALFVSPNPSTAYSAGDPPELYVRETAADGTQSTVLVSRDTLLPAVSGLPAPAAQGVFGFTPANGRLNSSESPETGNSYVWATPDGSRAFFLSTDQLTAAAPADNTGKLYEFDVETNALTYLADATPPTTEAEPAGAEVLASSQDGSRLLFVKSVSQPVNGRNKHLLTELDLWTDGPEGPSDGHVTPIAPLGEVEASNVFPFVRASRDGSSFVFETSDPLPGFNFNNNGSTPGGPKFTQVYRYEVATNSLDCLSCPPTGVTPSGPAQLSTNDEQLSYNKDRSISEDGTRVFFDTPDPLVSWDHNTAPPVADGDTQDGFLWHDYDVYEWENGKLFLISTGNSDEGSYVGDNSALGNNVFFSTGEGLVPADTDGGYDVYDARIPEPGEKPASAAPCEGDVCQGPPSVPSPLSDPASATFSGLGNPSPGVPAPVTTPVVPKSLSTAQKLSAALKACGKQPQRKRARCRAQARKKYGPKAKKTNERVR